MQSEFTHARLDGYVHRQPHGHRRRIRVIDLGRRFGLRHRSRGCRQLLHGHCHGCRRRLRRRSRLGDHAVGGVPVTTTTTVQNTGNVALTGLSLTYSAGLSAGSCPTTLAIGATATCSATRSTTADDAVAGFTATVTASASYGAVSRTTSTDLFVGSAVPCTVVSTTAETLGSPGSVGLVGSGTRGALGADVIVTIRTTSHCSALRLRYFPHAPGSVVTSLTSIGSNQWTYIIPGDASAGSTDWAPGAQTVSVLPPTSTGSTPLFTSTSAFTVT